jgi:hypothetical protein
MKSILLIFSILLALAYSFPILKREWFPRTNHQNNGGELAIMRSNAFDEDDPVTEDTLSADNVNQDNTNDQNADLVLLLRIISGNNNTRLGPGQPRAPTNRNSIFRIRE